MKGEIYSPPMTLLLQNLRETFTAELPLNSMTSTIGALGRAGVAKVFLLAAGGEAVLEDIGNVRTLISRQF